MAPKISKVVVPVAGLGTRFLPATKAVPKELLPIVDRPLIQYAVDEARAAGIEQFIFITGAREGMLQEYFSRTGEFADQLAAAGKDAEIALINGVLPPDGSCKFLRQDDPLGIGHAVWLARDEIGDEAFAVLFPDDLIRSKTSTLKSMVAAHGKVGGNIIAVEEVARQSVSKYGIIDPGEKLDDLIKIKALVEKPAIEDAPSTMGIIGRYILMPGIMEVLGDHKVGAGGEIQLTDAINAMVAFTPTHGLPIVGTRYDCGSKAGFVAATIDYALERDDIGKDVRTHISAS